MISERESRSSTHGGMVPGSKALPLPSRTARSGVPRLRWPSEARAIPKRCAHCGGAVVVADQPTPEHRLADATCLLCARVACELIHDGSREPMTAERFKALPTSTGRPYHRSRGNSAVGTEARVVSALAEHGLLDVTALTDLLDVTASTVTSAVSRARKLGHDIVWTSAGYRLESGQRNAAWEGRQ